MFAGLEHVAICAKDTEALAKWYCDVLGFTVCYRGSKAPPTLFVKQPGGSMIEIMPAKGPRPSRGENDEGLAHLALSVTGFDAAFQALKAKGVRFIGEPKDASGGVKVVFFSDPEGNLIQIIYRPTPL
jgi:catechol 2,3-dioxygenase-like lactoylglutathione lyase family enzyme